MGYIPRHHSTASCGSLLSARSLPLPFFFYIFTATGIPLPGSYHRRFCNSVVPGIGSLVTRCFLPIIGSLVTRCFLPITGGLVTLWFLSAAVL